jgi:hypothetical protein
MPAKVKINFESVTIKLLVKLIKIMEAIMQGQPEVESAIQALTASIVALAGAIAAQPKPVDETAQVNEINALKAQIDALTAQLAALAPAPTPAPPPAS